MHGTRRLLLGQTLVSGAGLLGLLGAAVGLAGCTQQSGAGGTVSTTSGTAKAAPDAKRGFVVAPPLALLGNLVDTIKKAEPMAAFLARETGLPVNAYAPGDYAGSIIGLRDGSLDFAFLPAVLFLRAQSDSGAQPLFRTLRPGVDNKPTPSFTSVIVARTDSGIDSLSAVKGKHIVAIDVSDAAGWVLPAAYVKKNGIDPAKDIQVEYRKDGPDALTQVLNKKADVAFVAKNDLQDPKVLKADADAAKDLKVLASIENAPLDVLAVRKGLDAKALENFRTAFRVLGDGQKATVKTKDGKEEPILAQWGITGLTEARDADFTALREAAKSVGIKIK